MADAPRPKRVFKAPGPASTLGGLHPGGVKQAPKMLPFTSGGAKADIKSQSEYVDVTVTGLTDLEERLRAMPKFARDAAGYEMANIAEEIIKDADANYVPEDTGDLIGSGDSDSYDPGVGMSILEIAMWYGAEQGEGHRASTSKYSLAAAETRTLSSEGLSKVHDPHKYALDQHENMEYTHPRGGGPKYLELPFMAKAPEVVPRIAMAVIEAWGGAGPALGITPSGFNIGQLEKDLNNATFGPYGNK